MNERSKIISDLQNSEESRAAYIKAKLNVLIPSQIRALRLKSKTLSRQADLSCAAGMKQSRISAIETPGAVNFNLETLVRLASVFKVGLMVKFVSFGEMLEWDNNYSQDDFLVVGLDDDVEFLTASTQNEGYIKTLGIKNQPYNAEDPGLSVNTIVEGTPSENSEYIPSANITSQNYWKNGMIMRTGTDG